MKYREIAHALIFRTVEDGITIDTEIVESDELEFEDMDGESIEDPELG